MNETIYTMMERGFVPVLRCGKSLFLFADFNADKSAIAEEVSSDKWIVHSTRSRKFHALHRCLLENGETV